MYYAQSLTDFDQNLYTPHVLHEYCHVTLLFTLIHFEAHLIAYPKEKYLEWKLQ